MNDIPFDVITNASNTWNGSDFVANGTDYVLNEYDLQGLNATATTILPGGGYMGVAQDQNFGSCKEWTAAQHTLFQAANIFLAAAFLVPTNFKQSVLVVRALLMIGFMFMSSWAGGHLCSLDILLWSSLQVLLNFIHTCLLSWRFLPPTLSLELTELYVKVFKPLKVSKKHFKEMVKEARIINLERGDIYAVEDASPADEKLSILLKGKLRVTCDDTHLHFINMHQFIDSPEWEANHDHSDELFQVTVTAEEDCLYLCWPRMKLERFLRHRPLLKIVLDCIIGKDITQKLYSLNEHLSGLSAERKREKRGELWAKTHSRSLSVDAVNTGTTGLVRSAVYRTVHNKNSTSSIEMTPPGRHHSQYFAPFVVSQFPAASPFTHHRQQNSIDSTTSLLKPEQQTPQRTRSFNKRNREVKFRN